MNLVRTLLILLCLLSAYVSARADDAASTPETNIINQEVKDAIYDLQNRHDKIDQTFIKYLTTYAVPEIKRQPLVTTTSFILHSLIGPPGDNPEANAGAYYPLAKFEKVIDEATKKEKVVFNPIKRVPGSKTLWWIDIRNFNFTQQAWEKVSTVEPYFVEPSIRPDVNGLLRLLSGNAVFRMDWFVFHATDVDQEIAAGRGVKIYETLLYANINEPKTVKEFETAWGIDIEKSRKFGNESLALVTKSKGVALHNRILAAYRTELGWYYRTYDVLNQEGKKDYLESVYEFKGKPPAKGEFDAGEIFATNAVRLQVYGLCDKDEKLVDTADSRVVRHPSDILGNPTVRVSIGCHSCHAQGPTISENTSREFLESGMKLALPNKADVLRMERSLLSEKFETQVNDDIEDTTKVIAKINGLSIPENGKNYLDVMSDYDKPLALEDIARECGTTVEDLKKAAEGGINSTKKVPARLALLLATDEPIPRNIWDSPGKDGIPGTFQQVMGMLYGYTVVKTEIAIKTDVIAPVQPVSNIEQYEIIEKCDIMLGNSKVAALDKGAILTPDMILKREGEWVSINFNGKSGYIRNNNILKR